MAPQCSERLARELMVQVGRIRQRVAEEPGSLPRSVLDRLKQVEALLREPLPDQQRLAMLGHGLMAWHLDQGAGEVQVHSMLAALALRLVQLERAV